MDRVYPDRVLKIKELIASDITLNHFDPSAPASVTSDASEQGWSASLRQGDKIIAFASGKFTPSQAKYAPHERECLGAISGLEKFRHYLLGGPVTLYTDSVAISWLQRSKQLSPKLFRWGLRLQEFSPEIIHRSGESIPIEDCGSRLPSNTENATLDLPSNLEGHPQVALIYQSNFNLQKSLDTPIVAIQTRSMTKTMSPLQSDTNNQITISPTEKSFTPQEKLKWIALAHSHEFSGHYGINQTLQKLKKFVKWPGMKIEIENFIKSCPCQLGKSYPRKPPTPASTPSPTSFCEKIGIDFLGPFNPTSRNNRYIFFLIELYSHSVFAFPCANADLKTTEFFLRCWISQNDIPRRLITDNHVMFDGDSAMKLWQQLGIEKITTTPNHQASNGATERAVSTFKNRLRSDARTELDWDMKVFNAVTAMNHTPSSKQFSSPFELRFGKTPRGCFHPLEPNPINGKQRSPPKPLIPPISPTQLLVYKPGTLVELKNEYSKGPAAPVWIGPLMIVTYSAHIVTLISPEFKIHRAHIDRIAPFHSPPGFQFKTAITPPLSPAPPSRKEFEVENILGHKFEDGKILYLTKWLGYPEITVLTQYHKKKNLPTPFTST